MVVSDYTGGLNVETRMSHLFLAFLVPPSLVIRTAESRDTLRLLPSPIFSPHLHPQRKWKASSSRSDKQLSSQASRLFPSAEVQPAVVVDIVTTVFHLFVCVCLLQGLRGSS